MGAPRSSAGLRNELLRRKPVRSHDGQHAAGEHGEHLPRTLGTFQLAMFGVGATIGTGIFPRQWTTPSLAKIDAEYAEYARQVGEQAEAQARDYLHDTSVAVDTTYRATPGRSVSSALVEVVQELDASTLVIGSSADGPEGRIVTGSTADKLLHSSPVPLAIGPRGYRSVAAAGFTRLTCAFSDSAASVRVVGHAVELAKQLGTPMRVASFGVRNATMYPPEVGLTAEDPVLDSWATQAAQAQERLVTDGVIGDDVPRLIATGAGWTEAVASLP
jgi:nucleotide-binding universal stress UspA family protein